MLAMVLSLAADEFRHEVAVRRRSIIDETEIGIPEAPGLRR